MHSISKKSINALISSLSLAVLLSFLWYYSTTDHSSSKPNIQSMSQHTDFYFVNSTIKQFDEQGKLDTLFSSNTADHFPAQHLAKLSMPVIKLFKNGLHTWTITANSGIVYDDGEKVDLSQRVVATNNDQQTVMETPFLSIFPDKNTAQTDKPVTLTTPSALTKAIGMKANLNTKQVYLLDRVRGQYNARP